MTSNIDEGGVHLGNPQDNIIKISLISVKHNIGFKIQNSSFEKDMEFQKITGSDMQYICNLTIMNTQELHSKELSFSLMMNIIS